MKIIVTGGNGQLGSEINALASQYPTYEFLFTDHNEIDITNLESIENAVKNFNANVIINCAAYTAVDKAETEVASADAINNLGAKNLAEIAKKYNCKLVHISTDFIFDGTNFSPIVEDNIANPLGVYGATKWQGELSALAANSATFIVRTSWVYSSFGNNFVKTILRLCKEKPQLNIIFDQIGTPTYARDLAAFILSNLEKICTKNISGVFHFSNEGVASWYDFAIAIRDLAGLQTPIFPIETSQYPTPAKRPHYSVLNKKKIKETFAITIPYWRDSLQKCVAILQTSN